MCGSPNCTILAPRPCLRCNLRQLQCPNNQQRSSRWDPLGLSYALTVHCSVSVVELRTANFHGSINLRRCLFPLTQKTSVAPHKNAARATPFNNPPPIVHLMMGKSLFYVGSSMLVIQKTISVRVLYNNQPQQDTTISFMVGAQVSFQHKDKALQRNWR